MFRFLRVLALLPVLFMTSNLMAAGYTCDENIEYTECDNGYFLNRTGAGNTCQACSTVKDGQTVLDTENIPNGERELVCVGNYTGGAGGTSVGSGACTGCSSAQWECMCADGYVPKGTGQACTCEKASGFVCDSEKRYDSCNPGYYMATLNAGVYSYNGTPAAGNACVACPAGHYCEGGTAAPTMCTGATYSAGGVTATTAAACMACPDVTTARAVAADFPVDFYFSSSSTYGSSSFAGITDGMSSINQCRTLNWVETVRGKLYYYASFDSASNRYSNLDDYGWSDVAAGYYLTERGGCGSFAYYKKVEVCPAGRSCPGKSRVECNAGNQADVHTETFGLGDECKAGTWAAEGAASCTSCAIGTYTGDENGNNATGATSASACKACPVPDVDTGAYITPTIDSRAYVYQMDANGNPTVYSDDVKVSYAVVQSWGEVGSIQSCKVVYNYSSVAGYSVQENVPYDINSRTYDMTKAHSSNLYIHMANPGFYARDRYLDDYCVTGAVQLYQTYYVCPAGSYCPGSAALGGLRSCSATGDDAYLNNDTFGLKPCAAGSYQPKIGQSSCELAQPGYYVGTTGATKETVCGNVNANGYADFPTYSETAGAAACTPCPLAKQYVDKIEAYYYSSLTGGKRDSINGCIVRFNDNGDVDDTTFTVDHGSVAQRTHCYWDRNGDYGVSSGYGSPGCGGWQADVTCDGGYYNTTDTNKKQYYYATLDLLVKNVCGQHGGEYYSPDGDPYGYKCPDAPAEYDEYSDHLTIVGGEYCSYEYDDVPFKNGSGEISDIMCAWQDISALSEFYCSAYVSGPNPENLKCSPGYFYDVQSYVDCEDDDYDGSEGALLNCESYTTMMDFDSGEESSLDEIVDWGSAGSDIGSPCTPVGPGFVSPDGWRIDCSAIRATVDPDVYGTGITSVPTYSDREMGTECIPCPAAQSDLKDMVSGYGYWSSNGLNDDVTRCHATLEAMEVDHGDAEKGAYCYWSPAANGYGISETSSGSADAVNGRGCFMPLEKLKCDDQYYSTAAGASQQHFVNLALLKANACTPVELGYYSPAGSIMQIACPVGDNTNLSKVHSHTFVDENFFGTKRCALTYGDVSGDNTTMTNLRCSLSSATPTIVDGQERYYYVCGADSVSCAGGYWNNNAYEVGYYDYGGDGGEEDYDSDATVGNCNDGGWGIQGRVCNGSDNCTTESEYVECAEAWDEDRQMYVNPYTGGVFTLCEYYCSTGNYGEYGAGCTDANWVEYRTCSGVDTTLAGFTLLENGFYSEDGGESCDSYEDYVSCGGAWNEDEQMYVNPYDGSELYECSESCNEDYGYSSGSSCDYEEYVYWENCDTAETTHYFDCRDLQNGNGEYMVGDTKIEECYSNDAWPGASLSTNMVPNWYVYNIDAVQCPAETKPGYISFDGVFYQETCGGGAHSWSEYQDEPGQSSCKYCHNLAGGLFPYGDVGGDNNSDLMDSPYDCYGNGTGAYTSSNTNNNGGCVAGYYLTYTDQSNPETAYCAPVGAGHWSAGGQKVYYGDSGSYNSCPAGETTVGFGVGADEAADCGYKMHVGNSEMYLRSTKLTTPALNVLRNGKTYYASMTPVFDFKVSKDATQSFRAEYNGQEYWIYDQSAQPVLPYDKWSYSYPSSSSSTSSNYNRYGGYDNAAGVWKIVSSSSAANAGYPTITGQAAYHSKTYNSSDLGKLGSSISANFEPDNTKSGNYASIWCKVTDPVGNGEWVLVKNYEYCGSYANCEAAYDCATALYYRDSIGSYSWNAEKAFMGTMGYIVQ